MKRKDLKLFTKISFYIALAVILLLPISIMLTLNGLAIFIFLASVFGIPLSIVSMFSKENLAMRIFSPIINFAPSMLIGYALFMDFVDEFLRSPP
ncbi:2-acyl-glycerophospho-ethanolamine acyltransferase [Planococcus beigongshangi]|uniref:2-acyl-glycerophospho-ethanolamine acyltransferase n=1 Tax=Planococcus beigongshangi TaxID=2782536 RepID=UPI00193C131B|nr:2-acyl-glycerophospho-ethanolamine acyltransferase [Planococcus beigongshangi]